MLDSILSYGRLALLGIAMAFLINPYNAHGIPDDADGDYIHDLEDVCLNESYLMTYHEECLTQTGVYFEGDYFDLRGILQDVITNPIIPRELKEWLLEQIERLHYHVNVSVIDTFPEAQIRTCYDLEGFAGNYHDTADMHERTAEFALELAEEVARLRIPPRVKAIILGALLLAALEASLNAIRYRKAAWAAQTAHTNLCMFRWAHPTPVD
ncbi:MAG: hypothetical protein F4039_05620 [Gammaproteobacteria bacterium]|nr:hypothetical protein [Gammaproteobacteria bacterium]MYF53554.1 hypothetical protein [Gammaproteobacteria bacterium]MYK43546.1 hypothetical protein [Gammaproteobacteria bacterium]